MKFSAPFIILLTLAHGQEYELQSAFSGPSFFDGFNFYTSWDPTLGYVHYVDQAVAEQYNMINITDSSVSFGVDTTQILDPQANLGRLSIRLETVQSWTHGLFILDLAHMPLIPAAFGQQCGRLAAEYGRPKIDIIEFVNNVPNNEMTLHTSPGCTVAGADQTGTLISSDCGIGGGYTGCAVSATEPNSAGANFNAIGGGVYAMEWTSTAIQIWFFPRNAIPDSIASGAPDTSTFGTPAANFQGNCDIDTYFYNHSLIINTDFCGQYAGNVWTPDGCPALESTGGWASCNDFVALNPQAFTETYWEVNYLKVYQSASGSGPSASTLLSSVTPAISTSSAAATALSGAVGRSSTPTMSLAGTMPPVTTGSFTATSSVLSVLSSLSTESVASVSSVSASLASRAVGASSLMTSSASMAATVPSGETVSTTPSTTAGPATSTMASAASTMSGRISCVDFVCISYATVIVVQTVTPPALEARETGVSANFEKHAVAEPLDDAGQHRSTEESVTSTTLLSAVETNANALSNSGRCDFTIPRDIERSDPKTVFACTYSQLFVLNGELWTYHYTTETAIRTSSALQLGTLLSIDSFVLETSGISGLSSINHDTFTGSFTPTKTSVLSTTITAYPSLTTSSATAASTTPATAERMM